MRMSVHLGSRLGPRQGAAAVSFNPLVYSPKLWLDTADLSTMFTTGAGSTNVATPADPVGRVVDKSGFGNGISTADVTKRPLFRQTAGRNSIEFDGVNDGLVTAAGRVWDAGSDIFIVLTNSNNDSQFIAVYGENTGSVEFIGAVQSGSSSTSQLGVGSAAVLVNGATVTDTRAALYTALGTTTKTLEYQVSGLAFDVLGIGDYGSYESNLHFHEMLIYPTLSAANRLAVRSYLATKWSIS